VKISKEVKVGILVTVALAFFIYGFNFLKGKNLFSNERKFYAIYTNIDGLVEANPVLINGFRVGQVREIEFQPGNTGRIVVTMVVDNDDIKIPRSTVARIMSSDLLGSKAIELKMGAGNLYAQNGDTLHSDIEEGIKEAVDKRIAPLQKKVEGLISSIDSVVIIVQAILNEDARGNLTASFEGVKRAILTLEKTSLRLDTLVASEKHKLSSIFSKIESISSNIAANNDKITNVINNFSNISDSLAKVNFKQTLDNANNAIANTTSIIEKINRGEGSMGMLINNDSLYRKLDKSAQDLDKLLIDLRVNPERYMHFSVFGRKDRNKPPVE
jgi:phospholipid/cholesterol/gamma-HCH transport system substrate-binding protein